MKKTISAVLLLSAVAAYAQEKPKSDKETAIEGVTITQRKKAVEQKADRTIFDFSEQPALNSGTLMDGVKKLPGLVVTDIAGMMYQGKLLEVYMDGRPLNITSNELQSFLDGMPASAVERIEIITQPGAEFPATSGGAILNIITSKTARNYLTATYSGNYSFSNYDKFRSKTNNSLNLNARNKLFGWQLNFGQNYREAMRLASLDELSTTNTDSYRRGYFAKTALTFDLGRDRLLLNYDLNHDNNDNNTFSTGTYYGTPFSSQDLAKNKNLRHEGVVTYQKRFDKAGRQLDFRYNLSNATSDFNQTNLLQQADVLASSSNMTVHNFKVDYSEPVKILDEGKINFGGLYEHLGFDTESRGVTNLEYERQTASTYLELQAKLKKFNFILGTRAENYDISGISRITELTGAVKAANLTPFDKFKLFPNASVQYEVAPRVTFSMNYNKKITLPSISALNPNNTTYQNGNTTTTGNPNLQPTIFDNYEVKFSMFDYAFIGYNTSVVNNQVVQVLSRETATDALTGKKNDYFVNRQMNVKEMRTETFNVGIPVPLMIFTKPLKEIMKFNFNPDKINFMYLYAAYMKHNIDGVDTKGSWILNLNAQLILPKDFKLNANYFIIPPKGNWYYFQAVKPIGNGLDLTLSRKFMDNRLNISIFANDILNGQKMSFRSVYSQPYVVAVNKQDSRNFGLSVNYKIPTRNRLAKVDPNLLNTEKKEDTQVIPQTP